MMAESHILPNSVLDHATAIIGRTGSGKTYAAKTAVEHLLSRGARVCVIDVTGVWYGLRRRKDGTDGYPIVIFGGDHADIPITDGSGEMLGNLVATAQIHSCIIDVSDLSGGETTRFLTAFFEALYTRANRQPLHLIMDEADVYAPQQPLPDQRRLQGAVNKIVRRGRVKGLRPMMITQRPAVIDKSVLSQISTLITLRLTSPQDRKAIEDWVRSNADAGQAKLVLDSLPGMAVGEGWVWSPADDLLEQIKFPEITTTDTSRTPEHGEEVPPPPALRDIDLGPIREALAQPEEPEAPEKSRKVASPPSAELLAAAEQRGYERGLAEAQKVLGERIAQAKQAMVRQLTVSLDELCNSSEAREDIIPTLPPAAGVRPGLGRHLRVSLAAAQASTGLLPARQRILDAIAWFNIIGDAAPERIMVAFKAGVSHTSSGFANNLGSLRTSGLIEYPVSGCLALTGAGRAAANHPAQPGTSADLHAQIEALLSPAQWRILRALIDQYPIPTTRDEIALFLGVSATSSGFANNLGRLRSFKLIEYPSSGCLKAADRVFVTRG